MWGWIRSVGLLGALCLLLGLLGGPPAQAAAEFVSTWDTAQTTTGSSDSKTLQLPLTSSGNYNFHVDWGDGSASDVVSYTQNTHTYSIPGVYTVRITGLIDGFRFAYNSERLKLLGVSHWGPLKLGPGGGYFYGVENMTITATDAPDLSGTTTLQNAFAYAKSLTGGVGNWDVSKVTNLDYAFNNATAFNEDLGAWNVSSVTSMSGTFAEASAFNGDLSPWDVSKVTNFYETFYRAVHFNGNLSAWNVGSAKNMSAMFESAASFNKDIGAWNVSNVTDMNFMFSTANAFNADLSSWNTSNVANMRAMFQLDRAFNANISGWDTSKVTNLEGMFAGASAFNQNLGSWNVTAVANMSQLFRDSGLRAPNYDGILIGWGAEPVKNGLSFWGTRNFGPEPATGGRFWPEVCRNQFRWSLCVSLVEVRLQKSSSMFRHGTSRNTLKVSEGDDHEGAALGGSAWMFVAGSLAAVGIANATSAQTKIPDSTTGVITACMVKKTGAVRFINAQTGKTCTKKEKKVTFNQTGPQGPTGEKGATGPSKTYVHDPDGWLGSRF